MVFVQDEVVKAGYQGAWKKFAQENPTYPQKRLEQILAKMVTLGNPKYDALNKTNPSNYPLPSEWKQKIYRPDGSKKIVVFYNTTIIDLNASGRQMLAKYADVFNFFLKHQADYTLLWRPHPLLIDAIRSQHPDLLADYLQLASQFKESQLGIYDDSPDFYLAYTYADAFYGDMSSMAELFRKLNRPVIKQIPTYPTEQVPAEFDLNLVKEHLAKQKCLAEGKLPLAKLPACLAANTHSQKTPDYHFGLDIHRYVMNLANK